LVNPAAGGQRVPIRRAPRPSRPLTRSSAELASLHLGRPATAIIGRRSGGDSAGGRAAPPGPTSDARQAYVTPCLSLS